MLTTLWVGKLRHREVNSFAQVHITSMWQSSTGTQVSGFRGSNWLRGGGYLEERSVGEGLQNTKERDLVCPLTPGAEEPVAWKVGRGTAGHVQQETQGDPCSCPVCSILRADWLPFSTCPSWRNFCYKCRCPGTWELSQAAICSHTDSEIHCHPLPVPSVNLFLAGLIGLFIQSVLPFNQYLLKTLRAWHLPGAEDTVLQNVQVLSQRLHSPGEGNRDLN